MTASIYDFSVMTIDRKEVSLQNYKGKVLLIVNVASQCGFAPQYKGLEELHKKYQAQGFEVLGFPCNQFGGQEPGDEAEIKKFCSLTYDVTFPLFAKIDVNGAQASPLFNYLKKADKGILGTEAIKWNFTKFLVSRDGVSITRYASTTKPESLEKDIEVLLKSPAAA